MFSNKFTSLTNLDCTFIFQPKSNANKQKMIQAGTETFRWIRDFTKTETNFNKSWWYLKLISHHFHLIKIQLIFNKTVFVIF